MTISNRTIDRFVFDPSSRYRRVSLDASISLAWFTIRTNAIVCFLFKNDAIGRSVVRARACVEVAVRSTTTHPEWLALWFVFEKSRSVRWLLVTTRLLEGLNDRSIDRSGRV